ncbi:hypothetical protein PoB_004517900 [Plakobranchus ocellatus]|uniref:Uncharacterized protein n=1 Tax=Plakobranchus ocellatus TaxID=259542 RepID=A0AAV4BK38_9GAST|nr:hypothetical protein PoB_004517900 [Plakobranchus ocellatus]
MKVIPRTAERKVRGADLECRSGGGTEDNESALRFAETILSRDRAPSLALWPEGRPESLRSLFCGQAKNQNHLLIILEGRCLLPLLTALMDITTILCLKQSETHMKLGRQDAVQN